MRTPTKATLGIISLAILAGSYQAAQANAGATSTVAAGTTDPTIDSGSTATGTTAESTATTAPTTDPAGTTTGTTPTTSGNNSGSSTSSTGSASTGSSSSSSSSSNSSSSSSSSNSGSSSGSTSTGSTGSSGSSSSSGSTGSSSSGTHTGSAIGYRYGTIQLEVVKTGSKITAINLIQAGTKGREYAAVPSMLVSAALSANGSSFSNVGGATFTSEAFRSALESALAQF